RQRDGALHYGQLDPVGEAEGCGAGNEFLHSTLCSSARMLFEIEIVLRYKSLERGQFRVPSFSDFLGTYGITPQHVADALIREHLGQLLLKKFQLECPGSQQFFNLRFGNGRNVMEPLLGEVFDLLALDHAPVANEGDLVDAKPFLELG